MKEEILKKVCETNKNLIISGDLCSGKTKKVGLPIVKKIIEEKESFLVLDSKEEYINNFYDLVKEKEYNTVIINLRDLEKSEGWNLLGYPYELYKKGENDKALDYVEQIGKELFHEKKEADPFWTMTAADFFSGIVLGLFKDAKEEEINLSSVNAMINGIDARYGVSDYITEYFKLKNPSDTAYTCASATVFAPKETKASIAAVAKQKLGIIVTKELLNKLLSKTTFNLDDIVNKPTAIFVIAKDEKTYLNSLVSVFINQLYEILIDNKIVNKFNFILDNFDSIKIISNLMDIMSSCVSRNIKFSIFTRSKEELEDTYGNYINKLVNNVTVNENDIIIDINGMTKKYDDVSVMEEHSSKINYPKMNNEKIKLFDLISFVDAEKALTIQKIVKNQNDTSFSVDDLIKKIDVKLEEINKQENSDTSKID